MTRTRRPNSSPTSAWPTGRAAARPGSWTGSRSTLRRELSTPPTFAHPNSTSIGIADYPKLVALLGRPSTARHSPARPCRSSTPSTASRRRSARQGASSTRAPSPRRPGRSTRRHRPRATSRRSSSRSASRPCPVSSSSTPRTRPRSPRGSQASSTPRDAKGEPAARPRRSRACRDGSIARCPGLELPVTATTLRYPTRAEIRRSGSASGSAAASTASTRSGFGNSRAGRRLGQSGVLARRPAGDRRSRPGPGRARHYYFTVSLIHPVNPAATPTLLQSGPLQLP